MKVPDPLYSSDGSREGHPVSRRLTSVEAIALILDSGDLHSSQFRTRCLGHEYAGGGFSFSSTK